MVVVDDSSDAAVAAADMLAQAEHDVLAAPVLVALSEERVAAIETELSTQLEMLPRAEIAMSALTGRGAAVVVDTVEEALQVAEAYAPEHLCLGFAGADKHLAEVRHAGGIFVGERSGEVMADYVAGPSHVMPTGGSARFSSALSVRDFVRVTPFLDMDDETFASLSQAASDLARMEMLEGHARSSDIRRRH
jgi:histidinol dehydrogenase